jgi:hypothetical protein
MVLTAELHTYAFTTKVPLQNCFFRWLFRIGLCAVFLLKFISTNPAALHGECMIFLSILVHIISRSA